MKNGASLKTKTQAKILSRPNILWLTYEDTSPQFVSCYGMTPVVTTPNIDQLAKEGVLFNNAYATAPVCSASRSAIMTGVCNESTGLGHHRSRYKLPKDLIKGFPYYLKQDEYYTTNNSKTDYNVYDNKEFIDEAWSESSTHAHWRDRSSKEQAFFSVFNYDHSHQSRTMTQPWNWYQDKVLNQLDPKEIIQEEDVKVPPFYKDNAEMKHHLSRTYNSLKLCDREIGKRIQELKDDGLYEDTIIFCFADHGEGIPRGKFNSIGFGYRSSFVIRVPEKYQHLSPWESGLITDELVSFEDLAPTMLSLTGQNLPEYLTGRAIMGNKQKPAPKYIHAARTRIDDSPDLCRSIIDERYVYTRNYMPHFPLLKYQKYGDVGGFQRAIRRDHKNNQLNEVQSEMLNATRPKEYLFDIKNDPWETKNLATLPEFKDILIKFRNTSAAHIIESQDVMFLPESYMNTEAKDNIPYLSKGDYSYNPLSEILKVASWVGSEDKLKEQLKALDADHSCVRYWASIGLFANRNILKDHIEEVGIKLIGQEDFVKAELLAALYLHSNNKEYFIEIEAILNSDDLILAHQMLEKLIYLGERAVDFLDVVRELQKKVYACKLKPLPFYYFPIQQASDIFLSLYGNEALAYKNSIEISSEEEISALVRHPSY